VSFYMEIVNTYPRLIGLWLPTPNVKTTGTDGG
jgi:hypothetical protein